jgi:uncharacterized membrane protein YiaA
MDYNVLKATIYNGRRVIMELNDHGYYVVSFIVYGEVEEVSWYKNKDEANKIYKDLSETLK